MSIKELESKKTEASNAFYSFVEKALEKLAAAGHYVPTVTTDSRAGYYFEGYSIDGDNVELKYSGLDNETFYEYYPIALIDNPTDEAIAAFIKQKADEKAKKERDERLRHKQDKYRNAIREIQDCHEQFPHDFPLPITIFFGR